MSDDRSAGADHTVRLTVHPGLGKTATTSLQRVLRGHPDLWFGGVGSHTPDHPFRTAFEALLREPVSRRTWRARTPVDVRIDRLAAAIAEGLSGSPTGLGVLSDEAILGHVGDDDGWRGPYVAGFGGVLGWRVAEVRVARLAGVLARVSERVADAGVRLEVRPLLTIRRQGTLLASTWAWNHEYFRRAGIRDHKDLLTAVTQDRFPRLRFSRVVRLMEDHGLGPVTVLPLEALAERPQAFWTEVSRLVGTEVRGAAGPASNQRREDAHRWRTRTVANRPVARLGTSALAERLLAPTPAAFRERIAHTLRARSADGAALVVPETLLERIDATYADDLAALRPHCPFPLEDLGYGSTGGPPEDRGTAGDVP